MKKVSAYSIIYWTIILAAIVGGFLMIVASFTSLGVK